MRRPSFSPERAQRWRHDPIGAFTGKVGDDGRTVTAHAGPRDLGILGAETQLPPPGTEVSFVVVMVWAKGEPRRFFAKNVRPAGGRP